MTCPRRQRIRSIRAVRAFPRVILVIAAVAAAALMSGCVIRMPAVAPTSAPALGPSATADRPTGSDTVGCEGFGASMITLVLTVRADAGERPIEEWIAAYRVLAFSVGAHALELREGGKLQAALKDLATISAESADVWTAGGETTTQQQLAFTTAVAFAGNKSNLNFTFVDK